MTEPRPGHLRRRALCLTQTESYPLYVFSLKAEEILQVADISRVGRDEAGELIGYQRPEVRSTSRRSSTTSTATR